MPWVDVNLLELPAGTEHEADFTMLSDIFPTGCHGTELAQVGAGDTVAVFGAGPVGLMAALSAAMIVYHELRLDQASTAYDQFDKRVDGWTKVLLHPAA